MGLLNLYINASENDIAEYLSIIELCRRYES